MHDSIIVPRYSVWPVQLCSCECYIWCQAANGLVIFGQGMVIQGFNMLSTCIAKQRYKESSAIPHQGFLSHSHASTAPFTALHIYCLLRCLLQAMSTHSSIGHLASISKPSGINRTTAAPESVEPLCLLPCQHRSRDWMTHLVPGCCCCSH